MRTTRATFVWDDASGAPCAAPSVTVPAVLNGQPPRAAVITQNGKLGSSACDELGAARQAPPASLSTAHLRYGGHLAAFRHRSLSSSVQLGPRAVLVPRSVCYTRRAPHARRPGKPQRRPPQIRRRPLSVQTPEPGPLSSARSQGRSCPKVGTRHLTRQVLGGASRPGPRRSPVGHHPGQPEPSSTPQAFDFRALGSWVHRGH